MSSLATGADEVTFCEVGAEPTRTTGMCATDVAAPTTTLTDEHAEEARPLKRQRITHDGGASVACCTDPAPAVVVAGVSLSGILSLRPFTRLTWLSKGRVVGIFAPVAVTWTVQSIPNFSSSSIVVSITFASM